LAVAVIDIAIPVLNEERCLRRSVTALAARLDAECPYTWSITVIDNGSTDGTWAIAEGMAAEHDRIRAIRLARRGRGRALKEAWATSDADVVAYMDVDLSTGLESLRGLIDPLVERTADVSIGSRLARGAQIHRSARREIISRIYNIITRTVFGYSVRDAQCGFKAVRGEIARSLIPLIQDDGWFFDTELIVLAWRHGLRINEVPVRWVEDNDSRVRIVHTAVEDLRGIWRLIGDGRRQRSASTGALPRGSVIQSPLNLGSWDAPIWDFDAYADGYVEAVDQSVSFTGRSSAFFARRKVEILGDLARRSVGELSRLSVLDVGCGTGTTDQFLVDHVGSLCGVDVSEEMLALARRHVTDASYEWYDGEKLPFPDGSFDVAIAVCVLHHVPTSNRAKFVSELNRVTRDKGLIAIFEHNPLNPLTRHAVNSCDLDDGVVLVHGGKASTMLQKAGAAGVDRTDYLFTPLGGVLGRGFDRALEWLPLGGQYVVWARAQHP
jgi:SAM-dependent methyltransferase/glycosyltransferase involved in cell wall biosynthesis